MKDDVSSCAFLVLMFPDNKMLNVNQNVILAGSVAAVLVSRSFLKHQMYVQVLSCPLTTLANFLE